jgi:hypothetical protein
MSWKSLSNHYGYTVNGKFYHSKIAAIHAAGGTQNVKVYFLDNEWAHVDWTKEPELSWQQLMDLRCHQLRQKYKTLSLFFSGGYDSLTILNAFIRNKLPIEELIIWDRPWLPGVEDEIQYALQLAKEIKKEHYPNLIITYHKRTIDNLADFYLQNGDEWIIHPGEFFTATKAIRNWEFESTTGLMGKHDSSTHGVIEGRDKPRLLLINGKWYSAMNDKLLKFSMGNCAEQFYYSAEFPELYVKQCYMMIRWLENDFDVVNENLVHYIQSRHIAPVLYEKWNIALGRDPVNNLSAKYGIGSKNAVNGGLLSMDNTTSAHYLQQTNTKAYNLFTNGINEIKTSWENAWNTDSNELHTMASEPKFIRDYQPKIK